MRSDHNTTAKLLRLVVVLGLLIILPAIRQFGGLEKPFGPPATERTVFGEPPPSPADTPPPETAPRQPSVEEGTRARRAAPPTVRGNIMGNANLPGDLHAFLDRWRSTMISGDASAQADLYASRVDRFFTKRNVSRQDIRREKERMLAKYPDFYRYDIGDVRVESRDGNRAVISFRKDWDARGSGRFAGSERQRLALIRESGSWKIAGEEETKVYWVRRN